MTLTNILAMDLDSLIEMDNYCLQNYKRKTYFVYYCKSIFHLLPLAKIVHVYLPYDFYNVSA